MLKALMLTGLGLSLLATPAAAAPLDKQIAELNRKALDAYQSLDIDGARTKLEQAIKLAQRSNHVSPTVAQSFLSLGLVYVAGMNDQEQGLAAFVNAICIQRDAQLDPLLSTPSVKQVFAQALNDARAGACGPDAAPEDAPPSAAPAPPKAPEVDLSVPESAATTDSDAALDLETEAECPPGMRCGGKGGSDDDAAGAAFTRFFASVQLVGGFSFLRSGMEADRPPPVLYSQTFQPADVFEQRLEQNETRYYFNVQSPWVPDADSFDDLEKNGVRGQTSLSDNCEADGKVSGPAGVPDRSGVPYATLSPSKYCVRVAQPGFVPNFALRANLGFWLSERIAVSVPLRFQFQAGQGELSHLLIGVRGEVAFSEMTRPTGTFVSWFLGATYGQIQARPEAPKSSNVPGPYAKSGPLGLHTGVNLRFRLHRNFGFILSPEFDLQVPALLPHADLSGGVETSF